MSSDSTHEKAQQRAAGFLGSTYSRNLARLVDRVPVAVTLESVVDRLMAFVRALARHLVLLPCRSPSEGTAEDSWQLWLPQLLADLHAAVAALDE